MIQAGQPLRYFRALSIMLKPLATKSSGWIKCLTWKPMHKGVFFLLFTGFFLGTTAQQPGFVPIADIQKFKEEFAIASQKTQSIKSDFLQEKNLSMLSEKIISKGRF